MPFLRPFLVSKPQTGLRLERGFVLSGTAEQASLQSQRVIYNTPTDAPRRRSGHCRLVVQRVQHTTMQASQILRGMLVQPRYAFAAPTTGCSTSPRCSCIGRAVPHTQSAYVTLRLALLLNHRRLLVDCRGGSASPSNQAAFPSTVQEESAGCCNLRCRC